MKFFFARLSGSALLLFFSTAVACAQTNNQPAATTLAPPTQTVQQVAIALLKCQGNSKAQTVTVTFLLTNAGPNRDLQFEQVKAVDDQGNEYRAFDIHIGAGGIRNKLTTGVPLKAVAVIPKVLATTKVFKLVTSPVYNSEQPGRTIDVEFRDVAISWK
jgi:hypothetical protein